MNFIKKYRTTLVFLLITLIIMIYQFDSGINILKVAGNNLKTMMFLIPPIFVFIGLIDVWVPREVMIKHMGEDSGMKGLFYSFLMGTIAVGPLYAAFPIAGLLLKKGVRYANVIFFLCMWMSSKLPLVLIETGAMGIKFTAIHVVFMVSVYLIGAFIIEKALSHEEKKVILKNIKRMEN